MDFNDDLDPDDVADLADLGRKAVREDQRPATEAMTADESGDALVTRIAVALYGEANGWGHLEADRYWPGESEGTHRSYRQKAREIIAEPGA